MRNSKAESKAALTLEQFPRAAYYDPEWMLENRMEPNAIWLSEV